MTSNKIKIGAIATLLLGLLLTPFFLSSLPTSATNGTASDSTDVTLSLLDSISIRTLDSARTTEIESLDMELTPTPSGRFIKDTTVVDVSTSNPSGYMLYMSSEYTDPRTSSPSTPVYTTDMINHDTNINDTVANLTNTNVSEAAFSAANTITSGTNSNPNINHWGYSLTENNVAGTYNPIPAYNASQTIRNDVVSAVEHSYTPVTVGVNVDTNIASGTYTNNLVFSTIVNPPYVDYSLLFNANTDGAGGDDGSVSNLPTDITERVMATSYTVTIPSTAPTRSNYVFTGYNTKADGTGTTYQPGDTYTLVVDDRQSAQTETAEETLYAIWNQYTYTVTYNCNTGSNCPSNDTIHSGNTSYTYTIPNTTPSKTDYSFTGYLGSDGNTYQAGGTIAMTDGSKNAINLTAQWELDMYWMQTFNADIMLPNTGDNTTLYDKRDNASYTAKRLPDGNVWMTQNLRYMGTTTDPGSTPITSGSFTTTSESQTPNVPVAIGLSQIYSTSIVGAYYSGNTAYGAYYDWTAAHAVCPSDWHLPSSTEIIALDMSYGYNGRNRDTSAPTHNSVYDSYANIEAQIVNYTSTSGNWPGLTPNGEVYLGSVYGDGAILMLWLSDGDGYNSDAFFHYNRSGSSRRLIYTNYDDFYIKQYGDIGAGVRCVAN